jgi:DNA (cytosine-5)-methyltransferase 1
MHNNTPIVPYVSLCSGYEGIGLGLHRCIPNLRCIAYCEREAFAISNLVAKMENGLLDAAPVFTDVTTFPWEQYAPYMAGGILSFGWPCQPVSCAGKRKATEDERWLFDIIADGIALMRPGLLFAENVEGLLSAKMPNGSLVFSHCIERLESLHYKVAAGIFSASEVGAPHQRKRVFILAVSNSLRGASGLSRSLAWNERFAGVADNGGGEGCGHVANDTSEASGRLPERAQSTITQLGLHGQTPWPSRPGEQQFAWEPPRVVANSERSRGEEPEHQHTNLPSEPSGGNSEAVGNAIGAEPRRKLVSAERQQDLSGGGDASAYGGAEAMGNASEREDHGREPGDMGTAPSQGGSSNDAADCTGEVLGNTSSERCEQDSALRSEQQPSGTSEECRIGDAEALGNAESLRVEGWQYDNSSGNRQGGGTQQSCGSSGSATEFGQTQPPLGGDTHGTSDWLGYAELQVSCDNRTDELRLLGNGVVPATATRAFVTLMKELSQ